MHGNKSQEKYKECSCYNVPFHWNYLMIKNLLNNVNGFVSEEKVRCMPNMIILME